MSNLLAAIRAREAEVSDVIVEVVGSVVDSPARFAGVELRVAAKCRDQELLAKLVEIADRGCIMMNTLRGTLELRVSIAEAVR